MLGNSVTNECNSAKVPIGKSVYLAIYLTTDYGLCIDYACVQSQ